MVRVDIVSFQAMTGGTHKYAGMEDIPERFPLAKAFCMISSGNRLQDFKRLEEQRGFDTPIYPLVNTAQGWENEIVIEESRVLRNEEERETYVSEKTGIQKKNIVDITDYRGAELTSTVKLMVEMKSYSKILVPLGSGGLYLSFVEAIRKQGANTKVIGFTPQGENGIFLDPTSAYEERDGKLYYKSFNPHSLADKLVCPYTQHREAILTSMQEGHEAVAFTEDSLKKAIAMIHMAFGNIEPSGVAGAIGLVPGGWQGPINEDDTILTVLTGTTARDDWSDRTCLRMDWQKNKFSYFLINSTGSYDVHSGDWDTEKLTCTQFRGYSGVSESFSVDLDTLIADHEQVDDCHYNILTQEYI